MSTILNENLLLAIPLAPLAGSLIAGLFGKAIGRAGAHSVTILGVAVSFILSVIIFLQVMDGASFNATVYQWMSIGKTQLEVGFLVDSLTAMMICVVNFVSLMVHIYTIGYMRKLMLNNAIDFPLPVHEGSASVWHLADVLEWLTARGGYEIDIGVADVARLAKQINLTKEARQIEPRVSRQLSNLVA